MVRPKNYAIRLEPYLNKIFHDKVNNKLFRYQKTSKEMFIEVYMKVIYFNNIL